MTTDPHTLKALSMMARGYASLQDETFRKTFDRYVGVGRRIQAMGEPATLGVMVALWEAADKLPNSPQTPQ